MRVLPTLLLLLVADLVSADLADTVVQIKQSVVAVGTYQATGRPPSKFMGTGFAVVDGRHVITNAHVIPDAINYKRKESLSVFYRNGDKVERRGAKVIVKDEEHDLALLEIGGRPLRPMVLSGSTHVREGEVVGFTGFPVGMVLGLHPVTHRGIVSAITPIVIPAMSSAQLTPAQIKRMRSPFNVYQLDATAYPGNSGSAVYDVETGEVIGVINSVLVKKTKESALTSPTGISYAIPVRYVRDLLESGGVSQ
ncbi:MAG: trypsin-like peptidase domain-containing protein [Gammaproteobacteria bacterium]|nr:trypsin-like peptidase domain-containing protein [Gammaproteobacteria bacterium]